MGNITSADISKIGLVERYKLNILDIYLKNKYTELICIELISGSIILLDTYNLDLNYRSDLPPNDVYVTSVSLTGDIIYKLLNNIFLDFYSIITSYFALPILRILEKNAVVAVNNMKNERGTQILINQYKQFFLPLTNINNLQPNLILLIQFSIMRYIEALLVDYNNISNILTNNSSTYNSGKDNLQTPAILLSEAKKIIITEIKSINFFKNVTINIINSIAIVVDESRKQIPPTSTLLYNPTNIPTPNINNLIPVSRYSTCPTFGTTKELVKKSYINLYDTLKKQSNDTFTSNKKTLDENKDSVFKTKYDKQFSDDYTIKFDIDYKSKFPTDYNTKFNIDYPVKFEPVYLNKFNIDYAKQFKDEYDAKFKDDFEKQFIVDYTAKFGNEYKKQFIIDYNAKFGNDYKKQFDSDYSSNFNTDYNKQFIIDYNAKFGDDYKKQFDIDYSNKFNIEYNKQFNTEYSTKFKTDFKNKFDTDYTTKFDTDFKNKFNSDPDFNTNCDTKCAEKGAMIAFSSDGKFTGILFVCCCISVFVCVIYVFLKKSPNGKKSKVVVSEE